LIMKIRYLFLVRQNQWSIRCKGHDTCNGFYIGIYSSWLIKRKATN
jgi:hypothetical protein